MSSFDLVFWYIPAMIICAAVLVVISAGLAVLAIVGYGRDPGRKGR